MLTLIAAHDKKRAIGRGNEMPWHIPEDFAFFKAQTMGSTVIMGRKTWDSLPRRPLPRRRNIVVTRGVCQLLDSAIFTDFEDALKIVQDSPDENIFCIGGAEIYRLFLPYADRLLISNVDLEVEGADAFFPQTDDSDWDLVTLETLRLHNPTCVAREYVRSKLSLKIM